MWLLHNTTDKNNLVISIRKSKTKQNKNNNTNKIALIPSKEGDNICDHYKLSQSHSF